jgi:GNAT superfamily N-acetyltransferase
VGAAGPLNIVPLGQANFDDLAKVFGSRGPAARCWCQRYKLRRGEAFAKFPAEERMCRLREQETTGLIAYADGEPVGWCAVEPRTEYVGLLRNNRVPWEGRDEDKADDSVWAVTCLFTRAGFRRAGVSYALARAAVDHARSGGARALEAYPMTTTDALLEELHVGTVGAFAAAGLVEVARPTVRRAVMRAEF